MLHSGEVQKLVSEEIGKIRFPISPASLYEPVRYILSNGGKRLRPVLAVLAANMFTDDVLPAVKPALGIELFHNFTLLHDDLMDQAPIRRGNPTVHMKWSQDVAILSGDAMSILAYHFISSCRENILGKVLKIFNRTAVEVCEGQMMDMDFEYRNDVTEEEYIRMIELKTSVLIAASLQIGAICGGASDSQAEQLYQYGRNLGIAFQLQDDFLDTYGDTTTFGKKVGNDIVTNKKTYLVISALKGAGNNDRTRLMGLYSETDIPPGKKISEVREIFDRLGVREKITETSGRFFTMASAVLADLDILPEKKRILEDFSRTLMYRKS